MNINELLPKPNRLPCRQIFDMVSPFELGPGCTVTASPEGSLTLSKLTKANCRSTSSPSSNPYAAGNITIG